MTIYHVNPKNVVNPVNFNGITVYFGTAVYVISFSIVFPHFQIYQMLLKYLQRLVRVFNFRLFARKVNKKVKFETSATNGFAMIHL